MRLVVWLALLAALPVAASARAPAVVPPDPVVNPDDRVRCKKIMVTGSWVKAEKVCKAVGEWRRLADRGNDLARQQWESALVCTGGDCRGLEP